MITLWKQASSGLYGFFEHSNKLALFGLCRDFGTIFKGGYLWDLK